MVAVTLLPQGCEALTLSVSCPTPDGSSFSGLLSSNLSVQSSRVGQPLCVGKGSHGCTV